ncbi:MAG: hypothetical protein RBQ99_07910 [Trichlorobacter sp.]|nr:hypothetical protein [Trichlorobacter sp.]
MKAVTIRTTVVKLELTEAEALWLKDYTQNSLISNEDTYTKNMREKFFTAISDTLLVEEKENE